MIPIPELLSVGSKLLDKFFPDPAEASRAKAELEKMALNGDLAKLGIESTDYKTEQDNLTARMQADMSSDSWLSKNIRPLTLVFILLTFTIFSLMSAYGVNINVEYVKLLGQWGMLIMSFYFGGRSLEKIMAMFQSKK